jgi:outer membrane protein assembly factor BamB
VGAAAAQWSMLMNGPHRQGRSSFLGPQTSNLAWRFPTQTNFGGAAVGGGGTVYVGTEFGRFLAIRPSGSIKWSVQVPGAVEVTPAILHDGRIVFVNSAGTIYVLRPDGSPSWHYRTRVSCLCPSPSPAIEPDGTIYLSWLYTLYAFKPNGILKWTYHADLGIGGPPAVGDGVVYLMSNGLYALNLDGTVKWQTPDEFAGDGLSIADDGTIYVNEAMPPKVRAYSPDGVLQWSYQVAECCGPGVDATPAIAPDGTIYVGKYVQEGTEIVGLMVALNSDGTLKWQQHYGLAPTSAAIGADGTIYFGSGSAGQGTASVYAVNPDGSLKWQYDDPEDGYVRTPPAIGKGQRVYAGSLNAFLAIGP